MGDSIEPTTRPHVVCTAFPMWSHFRGLCVTSAKLAAERDLTVTLLVPHWTSTFDKATKEVSRCLSDVEKPLGEVRVVAMGEHTVGSLVTLGDGTAVFESAWKDIVSSRPIKCSATGREYSGLPRPSLVIIDGFKNSWISVIRSTTAGSSYIPVLSWFVGFSAGMFPFALPEKYGGFNHITLPEFTEEEIVKGRPNPPDGTIIRMRGLPEMYDWELYPQMITGAKELEPGTIFKGVHAFARSLIDADGLATVNTPAYDSEELLDTFNEFMAESGKPTFHLGPTLPLEPGTTRFSSKVLEEEMAAAPTGVGAKIQEFLDGALERNGAASVIYIGFGTFFWPTNADRLWLMLETLADRKIPFILSHCSPAAQVPDYIVKRFEGSPDGLLVPWAPQQMVLSHKSIGWFVTHGGAGGTMDALTQGVPMIGWPFLGDQPINILHLVHNLDVAFEFTEVRTGPYAQKPIRKLGKTPTGTIEAFREELNSVLDQLSSPVGQRKRENAKQRQLALANAWSPDGPTRKSLDALIQRYNL